MTLAVQNLLDSFQSLSDAEKHDAVVEILKRANNSGDVPETTLCEIADELFQAMDRSESEHAQP
jgi:hypothetical protein